MLRRLLPFAAAMTVAAPAWADPPAPPPAGLGYTIAGGILTGLGAANLATAPLCRLSIVRDSAQTSCLVTSLVVGGALAAVGVPLLVVGAQRRAVTVAPTVGGVMLVGRW